MAARINYLSLALLGSISFWANRQYEKGRLDRVGGDPASEYVATIGALTKLSRILRTPARAQNVLKGK